MIYPFDRLKEQIDRYCLCWLGGAFTTGKTLLSVAIAAEYKKRGFKVYSNFPLSFRDSLTPDLLDSFEHAVIILDESGSRYFDNRTWNSKEQNKALSVTSYSSKMGLRWLYPSKVQIDARLRGVTILSNEKARRVFNLGRLLWFYKVIPSADEPFNIFLLFPYAYFYEYSTVHIPSAYDDALSVLMQRFTDRYMYDSAKAGRAADEILDDLEHGLQFIPDNSGIGKVRRW